MQSEQRDQSTFARLPGREPQGQRSLLFIGDGAAPAVPIEQAPTLSQAAYVGRDGRMERGFRTVTRYPL